MMVSRAIIIIIASVKAPKITAKNKININKMASRATRLTRQQNGAMSHQASKMPQRATITKPRWWPKEPSKRQVETKSGLSLACGALFPFRHHIASIIRSGPFRWAHSGICKLAGFVVSSFSFFAYQDLLKGLVSSTSGGGVVKVEHEQTRNRDRKRTL